MGRLLMAGALACVALHAQDTNKTPSLSDRQMKALENALKGADIGRVYTLRDGVVTVTGSDSPVCMAPMPMVKPNGVDPKMIRPVPRQSFGMPVIPPPPICGQHSDQSTK